MPSISMQPLLHSEVYGTENRIDNQTTYQPLVILHGLFGSSSNWRSIAKQLARHFEVHVLDLRNHGESFWSEDTSYSDMAQDVLHYLQSKKLDQPIVLGHSMGGKVAMTLALSHPNSIRQLIIADIAPVEYQRDHSSLIQAMGALPLDQIKRRKDADTLLSELIPEQSVRLFLLQNLIFKQNETPRWRINLSTLGCHMSTLFGFPEVFLEVSGKPHRSQISRSFEKPTLFIRGGKSDYILDQHLEVINSLFPNKQLTTLPEAGHWLHAEQPIQFMHEVTQFLAVSPS